MNTPTSPQGDRPTPTPPPLPSHATQQSTGYDLLPWYRKSGVNTGLILASILTCGYFPGTIVVCMNLLSGGVYYNKLDERGCLKQWHWSNKVVAVLLVLLTIARFVYLFLPTSK